MRPTLTIEGFPALERKLEQLAGLFKPRRSTEITGRAAEIVLAEMEALAPVRTGRLQTDLAIGESTDGLAMNIGPAGATRWRAHFLEFGTIYMTAQPFIRPAFDNTRDEVTTAIGRDILSDIYGVSRG